MMEVVVELDGIYLTHSYKAIKEAREKASKANKGPPVRGKR